MTGEMDMLEVLEARLATAHAAIRERVWLDAARYDGSHAARVALWASIQTAINGGACFPDEPGWMPCGNPGTYPAFHQTMSDEQETSVAVSKMHLEWGLLDHNGYCRVIRYIAEKS